MEIVKKCLKEWNAVIEALGQGKQSILIRKYHPSSEEFLLYPTITYARNDDYLDMFKKKDWNFIQNNNLPKKSGRKSEIKYFAQVEKILEKPLKEIKRFDKYHIWNNEHVKAYLGNKMPKIWILRVYKLKNPEMKEASRGMLYSNLSHGINIENSTPVLSDEDFKKISDELSN